MSEFNQLKRIRACLAAEAGRHLIYSGWTDEFCRSELRKLRDDIKKDLPGISLMGLTKEEAKILDFGKWDDDEKLLLIPAWIYPFLCPGDKLKAIDNEEVIVGEDYSNINAAGFVDNDTRFGYLSVGIEPYV